MIYPDFLKSQSELKNLIDSNGDITSSKEEVERQEFLALELMKNLLGCSIVKNDKRYILSELELYFGGIGDMAHDWYRRSFPEKYKDGKTSRTSAECAKFQAMEGPIFYFNRMGGGKHKRCDIVVGNAGVAVSFLIRGVILDDQKTQISTPNKAMNAIGLEDSDLGKEVIFQDSKDMINSHGFKLSSPRIRIISGKEVGFSYDCVHDQKKWNLSLSRK